ncbi:MAG: hypothetical protein RLP08_09200 [Marinovum algicola]|uniref:hypothetical protein n=1 Tax=Marinovum algicola TaxID=42444 RepID=UPI0032EA9389
MTAGRHIDRSRSGPAPTLLIRALLGRTVLGLGLLALAACGAPGAQQPAGTGMQAGPAGRPQVTTLRGADLVGLSGSDLQGRFGPPMLTFAEPPAEVWRYSAAHCVALFFLYPAEADTGGPALVRHVEVLPPEAAEGGSACLQQIGDRGTV